MNFNYPEFVAAVAGTLIAKYLWDRYLSQNSRITKEMCGQIRAKCHDEIMAKITAQGDQLKEGDDCFDLFSKTLMVVLLAQLKVCEHLHIDCEEIKKIMINKGLID